MKILYSWLKDFVDVKASVEDTADALTRAGIEVESIEKITIPQGVTVAKVIAVKPHPNADKLSLCEVSTGGQEVVQIVCGAPNVEEGMIGALATEGTSFGDFKIKKTKIRGEVSNGMLCSEQELGLAEQSEGIMSLPPNYQIGKNLSDYIEEDAVIEIEITPDRGDCLSVRGVAREVCTAFNLPLKNGAKRPSENESRTIDSAINITIEDPSRNPRYLGRIVRNVTIAPSPEWMKRRLTLAGIRPINNIVDITNYILIEYGQPMHAFDYDKIEDQKITVRTAGSDTDFTTLDGVQRKLLENDLLICDGKRAVALAGIMGGAGSEISQKTTNVFLECAFFEPIGVRKTSKRLGLSTDSSYRFERGVDPAEGLVDALDTAAALIQELSGGTVDAGRIDIYPQPIKEKQITLRPSRVKRILGVEVKAEQIVTYLSSLQMGCVTEGKDSIQCTVPLFRHDITQEIDLVEEVGRLYGYDNIDVAQVAPVSLVRPESIVERKRDMARFSLTYSGFNEIITNSMTGEKKNHRTAPDKNPVSLLNPLNPDMAQMRTTMAPSLIETVGYNLNRKNRGNKFFEIGRVFEKSLTPTLAEERDILAIIIEGDFWRHSWNSAPRQSDFFILKGVLENFSAHCKIGALTFSTSEQSGPLYGGESALITGDYGITGSAGKVSKEVCSFFEIKSPLYYAQLDITQWLTKRADLPGYKPLPKYPSLERDFCFVMPEELSSTVIGQQISSISPLVKNVMPFDVYRGEKLGNGSKSITFSVSFQSQEKTLSDKEVERICKKIISTMEVRHGAVLRD